MMQTCLLSQAFERQERKGQSDGRFSPQVELC